MSSMDYIKKKLREYKSGPLDGCKSYSLVIPIVLIDGNLSFLFEQRALDLTSQPGEVCFPGGRIEAGESPLEAALREMEEEIGLKKDDAELLCQFDTVYGYGNFMLYTYIVYIENYSSSMLKINRSEVHKTFTVPLSFFSENKPIELSGKVKTEIPDDFPYELLKIERSYRWRRGKWDLPIYQYKADEEDQVIWGLTGRIVKKAVEVIASFSEEEIDEEDERCSQNK